MTRGLTLLLAGALCVATLGACTRNTGQARSEVHVLVDLSETWFNDASGPRNKTLLTEIGAGIAQYAQQSEPPVSAQYRAIGQVSLGRLPLCDAVYDPVRRPTKAKRPDYLVTTPKGLSVLLTLTCPDKIVHGKGEPLTEITQAINASAAAMTPSVQKRFMIIASDMLEESAADRQIPDSLAGVRVLIVYRPVDNDLRHPAELTARINGWSTRLRKAGAVEVATAPDESLKASAIADFLFQQ